MSTAVGGFGAAPSADRHWNGGAGCHMLLGGVGGLRVGASCHGDAERDSKG